MDVTTMSLSLIELNRDCLQQIALKLDPVSLVSFSFACTTFRCQVISRGPNGKVSVVPVISPVYGILGIPRDVIGFKICEQAVKYDLPGLFDYWTGLLKCAENLDYLVLIKYAGGIKPREKGLDWIAKIFRSLFANNISVQDTDDELDAFTNGAIEANDVDHYLEAVHAPMVCKHDVIKYVCSKCDLNGGITEREEKNQLCARRIEHFKKALRCGALNILEYLIDKINDRVDDEREPFDFDSDEPDDLLAPAMINAACNNPNSLRWFIDHLPDSGNQSVASPTRIRIFEDMYCKVLGRDLCDDDQATTERVCILLTHPFFSCVTDADIPKKNVSTEFAFSLAAYRPTMIPKLGPGSLIAFVDNKLDPRSEIYLKEFTIEQIYNVILDGTHNFELNQIIILMERFPAPDQINEAFDEVHSSYKFVEQVKAFLNLSFLQKDNFIAYLITHHSSDIYKLQGEGIISDDVLFESFKKSNEEKKKAESAKKRGKATPGAAKGKSAPKKKAPPKKKYARRESEELDEDSEDS